MKLKGKTVIITGATSGIGKAVARLFLEEGARVAVNYHSDDEKKARTKEEFEGYLTEHGRDLTDVAFYLADVSSHDDVAEMFEKVESELGSLDVLVNNAGTQHEKASHELTEKDVMKDLSIDLMGTVHCSLEAIRRFLKHGTHGKIVNNSSVHEEIPKPGFLPYSMSKGGIRNLTRTLALEYAAKGIRINSVGPGVVRTPMNDALEDEDVLEETLDNIPTERIIEPEAIARTFLYLSCDDSKHVTGQTLFVDGGLTLYPAFKENWSSK